MVRNVLKCTILAHMRAQQLTTVHMYSVSHCDPKTVVQIFPKNGFIL